MKQHLLLLGFISILGQVVLLRELNVAFYGVELIYIFALGFWLLGTAAGSLGVRRKINPTQGNISLLFLIWGIIFIFDIAFIRSIRVLFGGVPGAFLPFQAQLLALSAAVLPVSLLLGVIFRWIANLFLAGNKTLAAAYSIECAGGIAGGIVSTLLLKAGVQNFFIALICGAAVFIFAGFYSFKTGSVKIKLIYLVVFISFVLICFNASDIDTRLTRQNHKFLVESEDTPYGRVSITSFEGQVSVYENDALSFETEGTASEEFVHLSLLQHQSPESILVLGGGIEGIICELNKYKLKRKDYVEVNGRMIGAVKKFLPKEINNSLSDAGVNIQISDPRNFLNSCSKYDVILIGMPEPSSGQHNRFYTKEFFSKCLSKLKPAGIIAFRLRSAENLWTPQLTARNISIYGALKASFKNIVVLPGVTNIFIASNSSLQENALVLADRLRDRNLSTRLITPEYVKYIYTNDRYFEIERTLTGGSAPVNSDVKPVCYHYTMAIWLSKFFPGITSQSFYSNEYGDGKYNSYPSVLLILFALLFILGRKYLPFKRIMLAAAAGFLGMVYETILILYYQVTCGILFQDIGILITSFMTGMTLGSYSIVKFAVRVNGGYVIPGRVGIILLLVLSLINFIFSTFIIKENVGLAGSSLLLVFTGFATAGLFTYASLNRVKSQRKAVSSLYPADLAGSCAGTLGASLFLIPVSGLASTGLLLGILSILSLIFI